MTARDRRAAAALLAAALGLLLALALARPASAPAAAPAIRAPAAIVVEPATGDVVFQRQASRSRPVASTTKLMTALVTLEHAKLSQVLVTVPYRASPAESIIGLHAGERMTVADLLRGLLLASANDAAATLAARVGGSQSAFVALMNRRARQLGLTHTHYANAIGLDDAGQPLERRGSGQAHARSCAATRSSARSPTCRARRCARAPHPRTILNRNLLVRAVPEVNGVKTGHTSQRGLRPRRLGHARRASRSSRSSSTSRARRRATPTRSRSSRYGLGRYHRVQAGPPGQAFATVKLAHRDEHAQLVAARTVVRTARRGERLPTRVLDVPHELDGPLPAGSRVGTIQVRWRGRTSRACRW